ncbi:MAG: NAD(P)/FAD-dependent oxidoreductase [Oligoflexus sp.]
MTIMIKQLTVPVSEKSQDLSILDALRQDFGIHKEQIHNLRIRKKSLDARRKARVVHHFQVELDLDDEQALLSKYQTAMSLVEAKPHYHPLDGLQNVRQRRMRHRPVIIGSGPAGSFAALVLAEAGFAPLVIERGEPVEARLRTVNKLRSQGEFAEESNYCFGEGGAGTFSDGKLTCGRNHPLIRYLFEEWVRFGAPADILYEAHPHIGTDYLLRIAINMRKYLESLGVDFYFGRRFVGFSTGKSARYQVQLADGEEISTDHLILAIGHSARDTYQILLDHGLALAPKPFAIGARFEHPQELINQIQLGSCQLLPAAEYKLAAHVGERGIWTFCMCPGGHLLPTSAQPGHLAINGMSYHARNSGFANAAVVVNVNREDFYQGHPLDGMYFQQRIERLAFQAGGGGYLSPAQRLVDFLKGRDSRGELKSTYKPGVTAARLDRILPDFVVHALQNSLDTYNKKMKGFISPEAIVAGVETKTSSPIVMHRDKSLQSTSHPGLYPTGEGAGFAGGIVSAALDGVKVAKALLESFQEESLLQHTEHVNPLRSQGTGLEQQL